MSEWIEVVDWDNFQHYKKRRPPWIKNYLDLLNNDDYRDLTAHQRAVLHGLWMLYAASGCQIHANTASLTRQLALRVSSRQLEALNHAGFLRIVDSRPLARGYPRDRDIKKRSKTTRKNEEPELLSFDQYLATKVKA